MKGKNNITVVIPWATHREIEVVPSLKKQNSKVKILIEVGTNIPQNRNKGARKAKTEIVSFVDAHSIVPKDWSTNILHFFKEHKDIDIVGGPQLIPSDESFIGRASSHALSSIFGSGKASIRYKEGIEVLDADEFYLTSASLACRREVFDKISFDEKFYEAGEDIKFISDAKNAGFKVAYSPKLKVFHRRRSTLKSFSQQMFRYATGRAKKERISQIIRNPSFLIPSLFVIYLILSPFLAYFLSSKMLIPLWIYLILNILFSIKESIQNKDLKSLFIIPLLFLIIHLSYGIGLIYSYSKSRFK